MPSGEVLVNSVGLVRNEKRRVSSVFLELLSKSGEGESAFQAPLRHQTIDQDTAYKCGFLIFKGFFARRPFYTVQTYGTFYP